MAKNLGEVFIKSVVRQVGRDTGKVISNKVYKDAHSTPIRMVSSDTSPQFSGTRRKYRHDLDRVVNGDLPSTKAKAKKQIVALENAYEAFVKGMTITDLDTLLAFKNWSLKSIDFIDDVLKIVSHEEVETLASDVKATIEGTMKSAVDAANAMKMPSEEELMKPRSRARKIFFIGLGLLFVPLILAGFLVRTENDTLLGVSGLITMWGGVQTLWGLVALWRSWQERRKKVQYMGTTIQELKSEVTTW
tara:strand:- start:227 stop:967 length:741 start_codon:yes stop_codon:yes gene_type:complete